MVDKKELYQTFLGSLERSEKLKEMATRKNLDLPLDEDVNITNTTSGISGKHLLGVGAIMFAGLLGWRGIDKLSFEPSHSTPATLSPAPQEYDVTFWVDGEEITVTEPEE